MAKAFDGRTEPRYRGLRLRHSSRTFLASWHQLEQQRCAVILNDLHHSLPHSPLHSLQMSEVPDEAANVPPKTGLGFGLGTGISILGGSLPQSAQNQTPPVISNFSDGSWRIFSMYLERAKEEDEKIAESWQADANGILVFVRLPSSPMLRANSLVIDWFILRCRRIFDLSLNSRHSTEPTRHLQLLPRRYLSESH